MVGRRIESGLKSDSLTQFSLFDRRFSTMGFFNVTRNSISRWKIRSNRKRLSIGWQLVAILTESIIREPCWSLVRSYAIADVVAAGNATKQVFAPAAAAPSMARHESLLSLFA